MSAWGRLVWRWATPRASLRSITSPSAPEGSVTRSGPLAHRLAVAPAGAARRERPVARPALALLALAGLFRLYLIARGWPQLDSDEGIIGLMGLHILRGEHPIFFWGQFYMGALQAYLAAGLFAIFGASAFTLHIMALLLTLGFLAAMYALGRAAFGRAVGLLTLGWLAFGPSFATLRELMATGGYQETLLLGALLLLGVWDRLRQPYALPRTRSEWARALATYAALGLAGGLGLWSDLLILPVLFVAAGALLVGRTRETLLGGALLVALFFVVGAWPYISYNVTHNNATYRQLVKQNRPAGQENSSLPKPDAWQRQIGETLTVALPATVGSPHVCPTRGEPWVSYPPSEAARTTPLNPVCNGANLLLSLGVLALYALAGWGVLRALWLWARWLARLARTLEGEAARRGWLGERRGRVASRRKRATGRFGLPALPAAPNVAPEVSARLWLRAMMLLVAAMTLAAYTTSTEADAHQFTSARYLLPLYLSAPLLVGPLWGCAAPLLSPALAALRGRVEQARAAGWPERLAWRPLAGAFVWRAQARGGKARLGASVALALLLGLSLYGGALTLARASDGSHFATPISPDDQRILAFLDAHQITAFYGDYWSCYRLAFETRERLTCAVRGDNGMVGLQPANNRFDWVNDASDPAEDAMDAVAYPAYLIPAGTPQDAAFYDEAAAIHKPHDHYRRAVVSGYAIYYYAP